MPTTPDASTERMNEFIAWVRSRRDGEWVLTRPEAGRILGEIEWGWAAAEREIDLATKCDALMAEIALLKQRLVGYELFQEAGTQEHFGDPIWEYYDRKLWRDILYWKARAEEAEAALAGMEQPLHSRECEA